MYFLLLDSTPENKEKFCIAFLSQGAYWKLYRYSTNIEMKLKLLDTQSCLTLCNPRDCNLPGSSVHGILQARVLEWVAYPFSRGSSWPRDQTCVSCIAGRFFTAGPPGEPCLSGLFTKLQKPFFFTNLPMEKWQLRKVRQCNYFLSRYYKITLANSVN